MKYLKLYFNDKPLFLCDESTSETEQYTSQDTCLFMDELSDASVDAMLLGMRLDAVHSGVFFYPDLEKLRQEFWKKFKVIQAGGGLVFNEKKEMLFIFRRGKWDLPKGKREKEETLEASAVREVEEETGLRQVTLNRFLTSTYHIYEEKGKQIIKESHWYIMDVAGEQPLIPQEAEDILEAKWVSRSNLESVTYNTFPSIKDVLLAYTG